VELENRRIATQKTLDAWRKRVFDWEGSTCAHLLHEHLTNMGRDVMDVPVIGGPVQARRVMEAHGWHSIEDVLDTLTGNARISPSSMLVGDLAAIPGQDDLGCVLICVGPFKMMGWHPDGRFVLYDGAMTELLGAWRG
jgi:hypothetical protein